MIEPNARLAISGANGWLGRELLNRLAIHHPTLSVLALGSRPDVVCTKAGTRHEVVPWSMSVVNDWSPTHFVHLAFLTRERLREFGEHEYMRINRRLTQQAVEALACPSVKVMVALSSGAAISGGSDPYSELKREMEMCVSECGARLGKPTVIARAWSLSGAFCTKPGMYLLYDVLGQVMGDSGLVKLTADHLVYRSFCDAGEFIDVCLRMATSGESGCLDSGGPVLESGELAQQVMSWSGRAKSVHRPHLRGEPDRYFSANAGEYAGTAQMLGVRALALEEQFARSIMALEQS